MSNVVKKDKGMKIAVWFDRPRDCLCFADRLDEHLKDGEAIPDKCIIRIPLLDGEDFTEAIINTVYKATTDNEATFWKIMDGIQRLLDKRTAHAISLSERLRLEWSKRSGGVIQRMQNEVSVRADEWIKLQKLREKVGEWITKLDAMGGAGVDESDTAFWDIAHFVKENGLDEPRDLPNPEGESARPGGEEERPDQPGSGEARGSSDEGPGFQK